MNILIHTWWFSRYKGSEFSVAYNFVNEMSKHHRLYVIVESCSYKFWDYTEFSEYSIENCEFVFIKPNLFTKFIECLCRNRLNSVVAGWLSYFTFNLWERSVYKYIKNAPFFDSIDLIHYVGPAGYHEPGYLYKLKKPYVWGPISGFENVNKILLKKYLYNKLVIKIKNKINIFKQYTNKRIIEVMKYSDIVIAATNSNRKIIENTFSTKKLYYFTENLMRISENELLPCCVIEKKYENLEKLNIIWCGSLEARKMPNLLVDSIRKCQYKYKINVVVIGGGHLFSWINEKISAYDLECIKLIGYVDRLEVEAYFKKAHLHLITSAHEANTTVMFEAMEHCVPTIGLNHCGMADLIVSKENGVKIDITDYDTICADIANEIDTLTQSPEILSSYAKNLREHSKKYVRERRAEYYNKIYDFLIASKNRIQAG